MADNIDVTPGAGKTVGTDDVSGVQFQRVKLDIGGDGVTVPLIGGQLTKAASLPVTLASDEDAIAITAAALPLPSGASTSANQQTDGLTDTEIRATALPISASALPLPSGAATSAAQLPDGHNVTVDNASIAVTGTFFQATQPVSAAALPLPSGAATSAKQQEDALTDTELRATAVPVSQADAAIDANYFQSTFTSADATTAAPVKAKTADKKIHVTSLIISTDTAMTIQLQDDDSPTVIMEQIYLAANGGMAITFPERFPLQVGTNFDLDVLASAAGNISVTITGYVV